MAPLDKHKRRAQRVVERKGRAGLPDKDTVVSEKKFVSPKGMRYRIFTTNQQDAYDPERREEKRRR
jgi:hypothetical protein